MSRVKTDYIAFLPLLLVLGFCVIVFYKNGNAGVSSSMFDTTKPVTSAVLGDTTVSVPTWEYFKPGNLWSLVSAKHMIALNYTPTLVTTTVEHAPAATQVSKTVEAPLASLVAAAHSSGVDLMLSSAYRSSTDQQTTYNELLARNGAEYVHEYVAAPGASEHQTGLAVDIASVTHGCEIDANACSLDANGIAWLRAHASTYGFLERYPSGKQSITGVAGEHWHYRYVGVPLAKALTNAHLTLDEFVQQIAPGYAR